jgi:hypothetical protein
MTLMRTTFIRRESSRPWRRRPLHRVLPRRPHYTRADSTNRGALGFDLLRPTAKGLREATETATAAPRQFRRNTPFSVTASVLAKAGTERVERRTGEAETCIIPPPAIVQTSE